MTIAIFIVSLLLAQIIGILGLRHRGYELLCTLAMTVLLAIALFVALRVLGLV